jgi:hypothetical protein
VTGVGLGAAVGLEDAAGSLGWLGGGVPPAQAAITVAPRRPERAPDVPIRFM